MELGTFLVYFIISFLLGTAISQLTAEDFDFEEDTKGSGVRANTRTTKATLRLCYGISTVGINQVYIGTSGTDNKYLHIIGTISEGPINGFHQVDGVDQLFLDNTIWTEFGSDYVYYELFTGTSNQNVCSTLKDAIPEWTDCLRYTAYIYVRLKYNKDIFVKKPDITLTVEGLKLYDPILDTTAYSNDATLASYDIITRSSTRGGIGIGSSRIDSAAFSSAKTYTVAKGWTANMAISDQQPVVDNLQLILNCFRGNVVYSENMFKIKYKDLNYESETGISFDEDDIIMSGDNESSLSLKPLSPLFDTPNAIKITYFNEDKQYLEDEYIYPDKAAMDADGDYRERSIKLPGLSNINQIQQMGYYYLERWRWGNVGAFQTFSKGLSLEPHDLIRVTHSTFGWSNQICRVTKPSMGPNGEVQISAVEEKAELYDDNYNPAPANQWHASTLPSPLDTVASVENVSQREEVYYYRERSRTRWAIDFDPPATSTYPFWDYAAIYLMIIDMDNIANDESGNACHGEREGASLPALSEGIWGKCLSYNGVDQRVDFGDNQSDELANLGETDFAISLFFKSGDEIKNNGRILSKHESLDADFFIRSNGTNDILEVGIGAAGHSVLSKPFTTVETCFDEEFHHLVLNVDVGNQISAYLDNTSIGTLDISSLPATPINPGRFCIGARENGFDAYKGNIDEVRIYSNLLTAAQINDLYNLRDISRTNLIAYWPFGHWVYKTKSEDGYLVDPVEENVRYFCKMQSASVFGKKEDFNSAYTIDRTIQGKTDSPSDVTYLYATVTEDNVNIKGSAILDPDIVGYEFRISDTGVSDWDAAIYLGFNVKPIYSIGGMRAGSFKIFCCAKSNNGLYSETPITTTFTVAVPPGYSLDTSYDVDYNNGSHNNTQYFDKGGGDYAVRVNHASALEGTFTTPEIDLGSSKTVRVQGDFIMSVIDASSTIGALWPSATDIDGDNIVFSNGGTTVSCDVGTGNFLTDLSEGDKIRTTSGWIGDWVEIHSIIDDDNLVLTEPFESYDGNNITGSGEKRIASPPALNIHDLSQTFAELFNITVASMITAKIKWGTSSGVYTNEAELFELLAVTATGRYFQIEVTITDPNSDQYLMIDGSGGNTVLTVDFYT